MSNTLLIQSACLFVVSVFCIYFCYHVYHSATIDIILWSHHEERKEVPGVRDNARNNARCTQAREATHGLDGQHQDVDRTLRGRVNQNDRGQRESTSTVWPTLRSRTAEEQNHVR